MKNKSRNRHSSMRFVLLPDLASKSLSLGDQQELALEKSKHLVRVLKLEDGVELYVTDGEGRLFKAKLLIEGKVTSIQILESIRSEIKPHALELWLGLSKPAAMEWAIEKAVECGATRLVCMQTSRSVVHIEPDNSEKYIARWQKIADEALEQSEGLTRLEVNTPLMWKQAVKVLQSASMTTLVCASELRSSAQNSLAMTWKDIQSTAHESCRIVIGPEGGFSAEELESLQSLGAGLISLGHTVYRVETAATVALAYVKLARNL